MGSSRLRIPAAGCAEKPVAFDFLINDELLVTSLEAFLVQRGISTVRRLAERGCAAGGGSNLSVGCALLPRLATAGKHSEGGVHPGCGPAHAGGAWLQRGALESTSTRLTAALHRRKA